MADAVIEADFYLRKCLILPANFLDDLTAYGHLSLGGSRATIAEVRSPKVNAFAAACVSAHNPLAALVVYL
jgi:hypothetical protein